MYRDFKDLLLEVHAFDGGIQGLDVCQAAHTFLRKRDIPWRIGFQRILMAEG